MKSYERMPNNFHMYDAPVKREQCPCLIAASAAASSSSSTKAQHSANKMYNVVNYGASTSKSTTSTQPSTSTNATASATIPIEFTRNRSASCVSNCLDCTIGCEVEFPLDAVACIFDCLTEACVVAEVVDGPGIGRLQLDGPPSGAAAVDDANTVAPPPRYQHIPVPMSSDRNESYLSLAFDVSV